MMLMRMGIRLCLPLRLRVFRYTVRLQLRSHWSIHLYPLVRRYRVVTAPKRRQHDIDLCFILLMLFSLMISLWIDHRTVLCPSCCPLTPPSTLYSLTSLYSFCAKLLVIRHFISPLISNSLQFTTGLSFSPFFSSFLAPIARISLINHYHWYYYQ